MRNKFLKFSMLIFMGASLLTNLFLISKRENWQLIKDKIKMADLKYTRGYLRLWLKAEKKPHIALSDLKYEPDYSWIPQSSFFSIAHALGPIDFAGGNSIPTFYQGLKLGFKIFEVDLVLTKDKQLICYHGESDEQIANLSLEDWKKLIHTQNIQPCYFSDLIRLAKQNPKIYFVLDVKNHFEEVYVLISQMIRSEDLKLGKQFIPQIYFFDQLKITRNENLFAGEIYTSYLSALSTEEMIERCKKLDIRALTLTTLRLDEVALFPSDLAILTHPVDDTNLAIHYKKKGVRGIYTYHLTNMDGLVD